MTRADALVLGRQKQREIYGDDFQRILGKRGGQATHRLYHLLPCGLSGWRYVSRETGQEKARWGCRS